MSPELLAVVFDISFADPLFQHVDILLVNKVFFNSQRERDLSAYQCASVVLWPPILPLKPYTAPDPRDLQLCIGTIPCGAFIVTSLLLSKAMCL